MVVPEDKDKPLTVVEFQFQADETIYARTITEMGIEMGLLQISRNMRPIRGVILFRYPSHDPKTPPWRNTVHTYNLRDVLRTFEKTHPNHPLVAVFQPVLLTNSKTLENQAVKYYRTISESDLEEPTKSTLLDVFIS